MLPCEPALSVLPNLFLAHAVQDLGDLVPDTTLALRLLLKILQHLVARDRESSAAWGILGYVKPDAFL